MHLKTFLLVLTLFSLTHTQITETIGDDAAMASFKAVCGQVPTSTLGLCNSTCKECTSSSPNDCLTCTAGYKLGSQGKSCDVDNSISNYTYHQYAGNNLLIDTTTIGAYRYTKNNDILNITSIVSSCQNSGTNAY